MPNARARAQSPGLTSKAWCWLALAFGGPILSGCASLFGIDLLPLRKSEAEGGEGGELATSGSGGSLESGGKGGSGGEASAAGGGQAGTKGPGGGRDAGGEGGEGGESEPDAGKRCTRPGALACPPMPHADDSLLCEGGVWVSHGCGMNYACDHRTGACGLKNGACSGANPGDRVCQQFQPGSYSVICGPDLVSVEIVEQCVFGCHTETIDDRSGECLEPTESQVFVEHAPAVTNSRSYWPGATIPVCIEPSDTTDADDQTWVGFVRDEVDSTWGRYAGIRFSGWDACGKDATGVRLTLLEPEEICRDELGGIDRVGYPGSTERVEVKLCGSYYDARDRVQSPDERIKRLIARHEFGHVLGFDDLWTQFSETEFMARGIDMRLVYPFTMKYVGLLQTAYGRKPSGAFVDRRGRCLDANGAFVAECNGSASQIVRPENGQLKNPDSGLCLTLDDQDSSVRFATCAANAEADPAQAFRPSATQVRGFGAACLGAKRDQVVLEECPPFGAAATLWDVEFVDAGERIRIREAGGGRCIWVRELADDPGYYEGKLEGCDVCDEPDCVAADRFEFTSTGQIGLGGHCFATPVSDYYGLSMLLPWPDDLQILPCSLAPQMSWNLSGRFENGDGSRALALVEDTGTPRLVALPPDDVDSQIFDSYFSEAK